MGERHRSAFERAGYRFAGYVDPNVTANLRFESAAELARVVDLVVVAAPSECHAELLIEIVDAGGRALSEKPLCVSLQEADALERRIDPTRVFVAQSERFHPAIEKLEKAMPREIRQATFRRIGPIRNRTASPLLELGIHDFDLAARLFGPLEPISAERLSAERSGTVLTVKLVSSSGVHVTLTSGTTTPENATREIILVSDRGTQTIPLISKPGSTQSGLDSFMESGRDLPLVRQAEALLRAIAGEPSRSATFLDGIAAVRLALRAENMALEVAENLVASAPSC